MLPMLAIRRILLTIPQVYWLLLLSMLAIIQIALILKFYTMRADELISVDAGDLTGCANTNVYDDALDGLMMLMG